jgi:hypothetical protein
MLECHDIMRAAAGVHVEETVDSTVTFAHLGARITGSEPGADRGRLKPPPSHKDRRQTPQIVPGGKSVSQ